MTAIPSDCRLTDQGPPGWSRRAILTGSLFHRAGTRSAWIRISRRAMACSFEVTLRSDEAHHVPAARAALDGVDTIEDQLTVFRDTSTISEINRRGFDEAIVVDSTLFGLLQRSVEIYRDTGGAFDITSTPLSRCWGFLQREGRLPSTEAIAAARTQVGLDAVHLDEGRRTVRFARQGIELSFGAIGKGYALDRVAVGMRAAHVAHALLSAGRSSLLGLGGPGDGWSVDLVSPLAERPLARVWLRDAALGTSGAGQQFVTVDGVRYGHVIDPRTGWPASGTLSATVVASTAAVADALSTAFLVGGLDLARSYCATHPRVMAIITPDTHRGPTIIGSFPGVRAEVS